MDSLKERATANGVHASGDSLLSDPKVRALFKQEIAKQAGQFKGFEDIKEFALISKDFTTENDMLTPSMKLKRRKVMEAYGKTLEGLYGKVKPKDGARVSAA
jgi:long-chain acyl-CoA synthetase